MSTSVTVRPLNLELAAVGESATLAQIITDEQVAEFARVSGDFNPVHMDLEFARSTGFRHRIVHGMIAASLASQLIGMKLPGPGALWTEQHFKWPAPVFIGDRLEVTVTVTGRSTGTRTVSIEVRAVNQHGSTVMEGNGVVRLLQRQETRRNVRLNERVALVTGGARGIGAAIARALDSAGTRVAILYRDRADDAQSVCERTFEPNSRGIAVQGDVTDPETLREAVDQTSSYFGQPVDVLVHSAGRPFVPASLIESTWEAWQAQIDVQVQGAFHAAQAVLPGMLDRGSGCIVNIGSAYASGAPPLHWTGFAMAKAALKAFSRGLAVEVGPKGIRVNTVSPTLTETDFSLALADRVRKLQAMQTPLRRLASVDEIAAAVVFLCSEAGEFITGADIPVCGGSVM